VTNTLYNLKALEAKFNSLELAVVKKVIIIRQVAHNHIDFKVMAIPTPAMKKVSAEFQLATAE
jgi:hypothetical protein